MNLRPYQQEAHDAVIKWIKKTPEPCLIDAATGAGKSVIISEIAKTVHALSGGKHILCLAPSAELVLQNSEKYIATGNPASIFSAGVGVKSLKHPVVFGTPLTVKNRISRFGKQFAMVVLDEAHGITPTIKGIIEAMRAENPNLRVVGLTATPYRMGAGYIYSVGPDCRPVPDGTSENPYFAACVYQIHTRKLISEGFLTQPVIGALGVDGYQTLDMQLNSRGQFDSDAVDRAYHGQGRKTAAIMADVVAQSANREGVMIFAATVRHAMECLDSLPPSLSELVTGETSRAERKDIIARFKARKIKYLVNVSVLTTGFDAPHVDVVAMLRATESVGLLQQIIGRGLRICDGKEDCLILDYAENIERHCPDGDIFSPQIRAGRVSGESFITCECPTCGVENQFRSRPNFEDYPINKHGYFCDLDDVPIPTEWGAMPAHFGRRCQSKVIVAGEFVQCGYRWTSKECVHCHEPNDIAARYCVACKGEMVDPNEKLRIDFKALKKDPTRRQTDRVVTWKCIPSFSRSGKAVDRVDVTTEFRSFSFWVMREPTWTRAMKERGDLDALNGEAPSTITYQKDPDSGFYRVYSYNRPADEAPE